VLVPLSGEVGAAVAWAGVLSVPVAALAGLAVLDSATTSVKASKASKKPVKLSLYFIPLVIKPL
jgi:hypothetical protein